jgi:uncharacterized protein (UPF0210 family)
MKIRSITYFFNPGYPAGSQALQRAGQFATAARSQFENAGYEVETVRLATPPFPGWYDPDHPQAFARDLESAAQTAGYDYISLGPALPASPGSYAAIPEMLVATQNAFFSGVMTGSHGRVDLAAVRACARIIHLAANLSPDGFTNLRFAALANVPAGAPFFPAAYHQGGTPAFALATEAAGLAVQAFGSASGVEDARRRLTASIEEHAQRLVPVAQRLASQSELSFGGIDFSLAPFPESELSLGTALERLGAPAVGQHGSLAAAALLADILDRARFPHTGFSGLMLPVLEDATLAARAAQGSLSVKDLLLYSAVCGTGLDTLPLPGDTTQEQLAGVLLDLAALAQRLNKPLTARLMPIPGKAAGDPTDFDFAYFANSRVMSLEAAPLGGPLAGEGSFHLRPRS